MNYNYGYYEEVSEEVQNKIKVEVEKQGCKLKIVTRQSNHPQDDYLYVVLAQGGYANAYNVWLFNNSTGGLYSGKYDLTYKMALSEFADSLKDVYKY